MGVGTGRRREGKDRARLPEATARDIMFMFT